MTITSNSQRKVGPETAKSYQDKIHSGFWKKYLSGTNVLEIGFEGGVGSETVFPHVIGIDKNYPNYDGIHLPFADQSQDAVYASHVYEHIEDWRSALREWYRVLRVEGHLVIVVPHVWLYEKKPDLPSRYNKDHKRFYAPYNLLEEIWQALPHLGYRIRHFCDNDANWQDGWEPNIQIVTKRVELDEYAVEAGYTESGNSINNLIVSAGNMYPSNGCYEIECVLQKTQIPVWAELAFKNRKQLGRA